MPKSKSSIAKLLAIIVAVSALLLSFMLFDVQDLLRQALSWIDELGYLGILAYILVYILACVFLLPGSVLTLGAGIVFGVTKGSIIVSLASTAGASAAFVVGRYMARDWVASKVKDNPRFRAIDEAVADEGWKIVGLTRLSPIFPFNLLNYAFGLTKVSLKEYVAASWIGMMPGTVMYVYLGSLAGDLATIGTATGKDKSVGQWILTVAGFIATVLVTIVITRIAKKALSTKIQDVGNHHESDNQNSA